MSKNQHTKKQIRDWLENAIKRSKNPNPREKMKKERLKRSKIVAKSYGIV
jgi:hypothetical protein